MNKTRLTACHECDTLQNIPELPVGRKASCYVCGGLLARNPVGGIEVPLALNVTVLILLLIVNSFPFLTLSIEGRDQAISLVGASWMLYQNGMALLAALIFFSIVVAPFFETLLSLYVLAGLRFQWLRYDYQWRLYCS